MPHYLGIDIGTFESKGTLVDDTGRIVATAARPHKMLVPQPGWAEHDAETNWWGEFCSISKELIASSGVAPSDIRSVGASGIGPCMLPVDADGVPLMNAVLYGVDTRAAVEIEELSAEIGVDELVRTGGNALTSQSVGPKILWLKKNRPELYARTHKVLNSSSFLVHRLTGRYVLDHYSACSSSPLYDAASNQWTDRFADRIIAPERLPGLLWTTDIAGTVTAAAADATGLAAGTPVIAGTIDAASEAVSVGVQGTGEMMVMYGSTMFIILVTDRRVEDPRLWYAPWLFQGQHACMSGTSTSGTLTRWFQDQFARELDPKSALRELAEQAATSPAGANGLVVLPYFSGERTPIHDPQAKGMLFGLDLTHTRADIYRAFLEGIAYGVNDVIETYVGAGAPLKTIAAVGGGTKNQVWSQSVSDVSNWPQTVRAKTIGAAYGNAFLGAVAVGNARRSDISAWNPVERLIEPDSGNAAVYARRRKTFKELYARTKDLMKEASR
ncbi:MULTISPECIES: FGGY-family carbohydrate kinase [Phyllobacteriaceae]|jgi:xylulokinase|uniref:Carbohydrate kinase n=1 Tax=Mesorhizobium hungaricum TaxID=1566387 RepID=A0A1C2E582_9HYPH|nr:MULTISPECIES: FGGY-family carbohydrate kinase [Mesorhizobium]MBN9236474.1 FGGY-family carbohydrate kinase [Mesorhizobium sp.]MDQ0329596.1 xylulokinase [Mesorhizobium sp. YL-MeA3-2017]OCX22162.1 carbohydrate kinase [Mesorhizobium hungaricum]